MNNVKKRTGWLAALGLMLLIVAGSWTADLAGDRAPDYVVSTDSAGRSSFVRVGSAGCLATTGSGISFSSCSGCSGCSGNRAFLGVELEEEIDHPEGGARLTEIVEDSPAERAGLERDDIVVGIDGHTVRGPAALSHRLHELEPGDSVTIEIIRDGRSQTIDAELGRRTSVWGSVVAPRFAPRTPAGRAYATAVFGGSTRAQLGVQLSETTAELRRFLGGNDDAGVLVAKVLSGTAAEDAGVQVGDLIVSVNGEEVANHWTLKQALSEQEGTFKLEIVREGVPVTLEVRFPESDDRPTGPTA
jgi:S1-C subfamily serine protease